MQVQANYSIARLYLVDLEDRNAFATRDKEGQSIAVVTYGMLIALGPDEDAWAGLIGHELAHHVKRHGEGRTGAATAANVGGRAAAQVIASLIPGIGGLIAGTVGGAAVQRASYGAYTRPQEAEADVLGLRWMTEAGYDPAGMKRVFHKLAEGDKSPISFLSTHPANEDRQRAVEAFIAANSGADSGEVAPAGPR